MHTRFVSKRMHASTSTITSHEEYAPLVWYGQPTYT